MTIAKKIMIGFGLLIVLVLGASFFLPSKLKIVRHIHIQASSEQIYPYIADFKHGWPKWSSFDQAEPDLKYHFEGPDSGRGAKRAWISSKSKMNSGYQKMTKADHTGVAYEVVMSNGFIMMGSISLEAAQLGTKVTWTGSSTLVTWTDEGDLGFNPLKRYMGLFINRMVAKYFEKSLAQLKAKAEAESESDPILELE